MGRHPSFCWVSSLEPVNPSEAKAASQPKWAGACSGVGDDGYLQAPANDFSDSSHGHSFFGDSMILGAGFSFFERQTIETGSVEDVDGGPAIVAVAQIGRGTLFASRGDGVADQPCLTVS